MKSVLMHAFALEAWGQHNVLGIDWRGGGETPRVEGEREQAGV